MLTIGMAVYDDFAGVWGTVLHLLEQDTELMKSSELVVVDNNPNSPAGNQVKGLIASVSSCFAKAQYVSFTAVIGTAAPRDLVIRSATGDVVCCMDSHLIVQRGALPALVKYFIDNPQSKDLVCGPLVYDNRVTKSTHFADIFRFGMWGTWATDPRVDGVDPFEIGAQGLGLFACRKEQWLAVGGFNSEMTGFGGEEWYIHEKFRRAGGRVMCLPALSWIHRFNSQVAYPHTVIQKVRNYILGFRELNMSLDRVYNHFVMGVNEDGSSWAEGAALLQSEAIKKQNTLTQEQWDYLIQVPTPSLQQITTVQQKPPVPAELIDNKKGCGSCGSKSSQPSPQPQQPPRQYTVSSIDEAYEYAHTTRSDINEHCPALKELASQCEHVTEFGVRHGVSTTALLAGRPGKLISYDLVKYGEVVIFEDFCKDKFEFILGDSTTADIDETDMLFIDTRHTKAQLFAELTLHHVKVRKWIVMHDTEIYGENGEDGGPGLLPAIREFIKQHSEWSVWRVFKNNYGLMILSRRPEDRQVMPSLVKQAWNYAQALARHAANGGAKVTEEQQKSRLDICLLCPLLNNGRCSACGCPVEDKTLWPLEQCAHPIAPLWERIHIVTG